MCESRMPADVERTALEAVHAADRSQLAERMTRRYGGVLVALPRATAAAAVAVMLDEWGVHDARVIDEADVRTPRGKPIGEEFWAVVIPALDVPRLRSILLDGDWFAGPTMTDRTEGWWLFPRHCVRIHEGFEHALRRALDQVTPEPLTEAGVPAPWVTAEAPTTRLGGDRNLEEDVETVPEGPVHPPLPPQEAVPLQPDDDPTVRAAFRRLCARCGFGDVPLDIARPTDSRDGFVAGRVWLSKRGPERVRVEIGPNADAAEIWATLLHEAAHGLQPARGHGTAFKRALVELAAAEFGPEWFAVARQLLGRAHSAIDIWIAVGVRAALQGGAPPAQEVGDEGQLARVVGRIQKLRRLARSQAGTPEGRSACAKANDLLARWDLGAYSVRLSEGIDDQMCDRWVNIGKRSVWRRQLAFHVASYCGVFCLSRKSRGWMHFFGRYVDVVTAEWFYEIWEAHIDRAATAHLKAFKARAHNRSTRTERTNFCDSAVLALSLKLQKLEAAQEAVGPEAVSVRLTRAEAFAGEQFALRGRRWSSGTGKRVTVNAAGVEAGRNAPMGRGVGGTAGVRGLLKG